MQTRIVFRLFWLTAVVPFMLGAVLPWREVAAQPAPGMHRIGFVNVGPAAANASNVAAFKAGLADLGYIEGRNIVVDYRWANQRVEQLPVLVNELLALKPAVIVSTGGQVTAKAVMAATTTTPVVFIAGNPVAEGLARSLAQPGGNATGFAVLAGDLEPKRLEIFHEMLPRAKRIAVVWNPTPVYAGAIFRETEAAAARLGLSVLAWQARNRAELESAFAEIADVKVDALFVIADPVLGFERKRIVEFANARRLPAIYFWREFVEDGGLASYGTSLTAIYRGCARYVHQILKGAKPGELPIQQPTTFELIVNAKTARDLGITLSPLVLRRADELID